MSLDQIVQVSISRQVSTVSRVGFGIPLILGANATFAERVRSYSDLDAVAVDFAVTDAEYLAALAIFSQNPRPSVVKIGRVSTPNNLSVEVEAFTIVDDTLYTVIINNSTFTIDSGTGATATTIATALQAEISGGSEPVNLTDFGASFNVNADVAGINFVIRSSRNIAIKNTTPYSESIATAFADVRDEDDDFYFVILTSRDSDLIKELAAEIEPLTKLFIAATFDNGVIQSGGFDVVTSLQTLNYDKTAIIYTEASNDYPEAAWIGIMAPKDPGSATWKFKNADGVTVTNLTDTEKINLQGKNGNIYNTVGGVDIYEEGVVASGEFIDIIRGTAYLEVNIQADVYEGLIDVDKIPFTNAGIDVIKNLVLARLNIGVDMSILTNDPAPVVTAPDISEVSAADKTARFLDNVKFTAVYAGAIHKVSIEGIISV